MSQRKKNTNKYDYLAGGMLTNGLIWFWISITPYLSWINEYTLANLSYVIYLSASILSAVLVCRKTLSKHLIVGLKLAAFTIFFSIPLLLTSRIISIGFAIALFMIYIFGSIVGSYLALHLKLRG
ncbi:MAG: hypothetical protein ACLFVP_04715 [Candidatus Bathyarchaeia archaeon]